MFLELCNLYRTTASQWKLLNVQGNSVTINADNFQQAQYGAFVFKTLSYNYQKEVKFTVSSQGKTTYWILKQKVTKRKWYNPLDWLFKLKQLFPLTRRVYNLSALFLEVKKPFLFFYLKKNYKTEIIHPDTLFTPLTIPYDPKVSLINKLKEKPFRDPFTRLATEYFQKIDKPFTPTVRFRDSHGIMYEDGELSLKRKKTLSKKTNREAIRLYKNYMEEIYGRDKLKIVQHRFNVNLAQMLEMGCPLLPEHIYRINIGVNNIEMSDVEILYSKVLALREHLSDLLETPNTLYYTLMTKYHFTLRECRKLEKQLKTQTLQELLEKIFQDNESAHYVCDLSQSSFNLVLKLLMTPRAYFDYAFTGKKIIHKAITGYYTIGKRSKFKPWLDLQELLQVFPSLQKLERRNDFFELLSHVVVKKHLIRQHPSLNWSVGALIPSSKKTNGNVFWYYVNSWVDDNHGDFNYTLIPAHKSDEKELAIKLYRSTAANAYNMYSWNTIAADLTIANAPGSGKRLEADKYELPFFLKRTIPLWIAYHLLAQKNLLSTKKAQRELLILSIEYLQTATGLLPPQIGETFGVFFDVDLEKSTLEKLEEIYQTLDEKLCSLADELEEAPESKIAQDIAFVGHSLGGALSQGCFCHFSDYYKRIPLQGCKFICYCSDAPATTSKEVAHFWKFIEKHQKVIGELNEKWEIFTQFEWGDPVPQSGSSHLAGITKDIPDVIQVESAIFKPLKTATAKCITTTPTHGRRIGEAIENTDYKLSPLTSAEIYNFDHAFLLTPKQSELFGFPFLKSPKGFEALRHTLSYIIYPFRKLAKAVWYRIKKPRGFDLRDKNGYAYISYTHPFKETGNAKPFKETSEALPPLSL